MKTIPIILSLAIFSSVASAAAPAVSSISENQQFARRAGAGFTAASLDDYEGSILILMMMTPWCPNCQSNAQAVGSGLLDYFDNPIGGSLRGKNDNGVPVQSLLLSTEEAASWDSLNQSFATTNGYKQWGLDANAQRKNPRQLLGYYRGGFINSTNLYDWGADRRRVVVLNLVKGSASHAYRQIVINQNSYSSTDNAAARAAINAILPQAETPPPVTPPENPPVPPVTPPENPAVPPVTPPENPAVPPVTPPENPAVPPVAPPENPAVPPVTPPENPAAPPVTPPEEPMTPPVQTTSGGDPTAMATSPGGPQDAKPQVRNPDLSQIANTGGQAMPEIEVQQPRKTTLTDGKARRSFGTARVSQKGRSLVFRITNTGGSMLTDLSISKMGRNSNDFIIRSPGITNLAPGTSATFNVTFMPQGPGTRRATLRLSSNDADESSFDIAVTGLGAQ